MNAKQTEYFRLRTEGDMYARLATEFQAKSLEIESVLESIYDAMPKADQNALQQLYREMQKQPRRQ